MLNKIIKYFLNNKLVTVLMLLGFVSWGGIITSPFGWDTGFLPKDPVPVDAIPDIGENQQIVFTPPWQGRSPQDIEDQISYPLTTYLLGIPGVKSIRSSSVFGFSSIFIIFSDDVEFYWSRSRILEKLSSLPSGLLPEGGVQPALGLMLRLWDKYIGTPSRGARQNRKAHRRLGFARNSHRTGFLCKIWPQCYRRRFGGGFYWRFCAGISNRREPPRCAESL